jgi:hypothetical protein
LQLPTCQVRARAQGGQARPGRHWPPWAMPETSGVAARPMDVPGEPQPARRGGRPSRSGAGGSAESRWDLAGRLLNPWLSHPGP